MSCSLAPHMPPAISTPGICLHQKLFFLYNNKSIKPCLQLPACSLNVHPSTIISTLGRYFPIYPCLLQSLCSLKAGNNFHIWSGHTEYLRNKGHRDGEQNRGSREPTTMAVREVCGEQGWIVMREQYLFFLFI